MKKTILILIMLAAWAGADTCDPAYLNKNIMGTYELAETTTPYLENISGVSITSGTTPDRTTGVEEYPYAQDFELDNSDYIYSSDDSSFEAPEFTVNFHVKFESFGGASGSYPIIYHNYEGSYHYGWIMDTTQAGDMRMSVYGAANSYDRSTVSKTLNLSQWYFVSGVWNGDNAEVYINAANLSTLSTDGHSSVDYGSSEHPRIEMGDIYWTDSWLGRNLDGIVAGVTLFNVSLNSTCMQMVMAEKYPYPESETANETEARTAIETGINSALSSPTIYTDKQMYLRYDNGTQQLITFDKVAYYNNQYWGFNYYTDDTNADAPAMGTSFYSWLNSSLTTAQVSSQVQSLIESTKR